MPYRLYRIIRNVALMSMSNEMLKTAKTIYQNLDADMAVEINSDK